MLIELFCAEENERGLRFWRVVGSAPCSRPRARAVAFAADGRGYPEELAGDNIPLVGRIAAVADAFDALTSDRVYRPALAHAEAARILREAAVSQSTPMS